MAISKNDCTFLFYAKQHGASFDDSLMLGRLQLYASQADIADTINKYKNNEKGMADVRFSDDYSEPLFQILGAKKVDSIDFSAYENASIIHDLNTPIGDELKNRFSAIVDGGTIEHVFNFPVAIKNCMNALKVGGHYIGITPANNLLGHGFYQFSPELYFRVFSEENGFRVKKMLLNVSTATESSWYEVSDPKVVNSRVALMNNLPINLMVLAEKVAEKDVFATTPQQIDYVNTWNAHKSITENKMQGNEGKFKFLYRKLVPRRLKIIFRNIYNIITIEKNEDAFIGEFNSKHFVKVEL